MNEIKVIESLSFCNNADIIATCAAAVEPTDLDFAFTKPKDLYEFSKNAYAGNEVMNGWQCLYSIDRICMAQLYFSPTKWQLLLVFKGTTWYHWQDLKADIRNVLWNSLNGAGDAAFTLGEEVRQLMKTFQRPPQLIITGHSLGGFLAQIAAYTIANFYVEDGKVLKAVRPHWGIHPHVVIFDSPSSFNMITKISGENPRTVASIWMDVTNFMVEKNVVNKSWTQGVHIGTLIKINSKDDLTLFTRIGNVIIPFYTHVLSNFSKIDLDSAEKVLDFYKMETQPFDATVVLCVAFSMEEWDLLKLAKCLLQDELAQELPYFNLQADKLTLKVASDEFVLKARYFVHKYKHHLSPHAVELKKLKQDLDYKMRILSCCKEKYILGEQVRVEIASWESGTCVSLPSDYSREDVILLAYLLCNSDADFLCIRSSEWMDFKTKNEQLLRKLSVLTTIILVNDQINAQCIHEERDQTGAKVIFVGRTSGDCHINIDFAHPLNCSILNANSREKFASQKVNYLGNMVQAREVFTNGLLEETPMSEITKFEYTICCTQKVSHEMRLQSSNGELDITKFADKVKKGERAYAIKSGSGTGKSWTLRRLRQELQNKIKSSWVIALNITEKQNTTFNEGNFESTVVPENLNCNTLEEKVFLKKLETKNVVLLIDSSKPLDENARNFLRIANEQKLKVVVATRVPLELTWFENYSLLPLSKAEQVTFLTSLCRIEREKIEGFLTEVEERGGEQYQGTLRHLCVIGKMCPDGDFANGTSSFYSQFPLHPHHFNHLANEPLKSR
jgi:Lipase (class 3)